MRTIILICISLLFFFFNACNRTAAIFDKPISEYVQKNCPPSGTCIIRLDEVMEFPWDRLYFFEDNVEESEISKILGIQYVSGTPYYSRKWFFLKDGKIVQSAIREIPEVDRRIEAGEVDFEMKDSVNNYLIIERGSNFSVERIPCEGGEFYRLHCTNCK